MGTGREVALVLLCVIFGSTSAIIHQLNVTEYMKMPPVYHAEPFEECFSQPDAMYCTVDFTLMADSPSPLMDMIQEYSEPTSKRFNHSKLTYGICVTTSCTNNKSSDLRLKLESCLSDTMSAKYGLKTNVPEKFYCEDGGKMEYTTADFVVAGIVLLLLVLNVVGSCYEFWFDPEKDQGVKFLLSFSIRRNWRKLVALPSDTPEPRLNRLKSLNGLKTLTICLVIMAHSMIISGYFISNTRFVEKEYNFFVYHIIMNGTIIVQGFFIISGFLLAYNLQLYAEKHALSWKIVPKAIILRWLRLTPAYALVLAFILTWYRFTGSGPIWQKVVGTEISHCHETWWYHLLYLNNYIAGSECLSQTWYIAADTQLYILGVIVCVVCRSARSRMIVLPLLFIAGVAIPAVITYIKDLDGALLVSPESTRNFYVHDPTYIEVYSRGHTNGACYIIGLALGHLVHYAQAVEFDVNKFKKYRIFVWLLLPMGLIVVWSGRVFYLDGPRVSLAERVTAAALLKPAYGILMALLIASNILKFENFYRGILEWRFWTALSRITYSAYLLHYPFVKYFIGNQVTPLHVSFLFVSEIFTGTTFIIFLVAFPFYLLVESPIAQLVKICLPTEELKTKEQEERKPVTPLSFNCRKILK